MVVRAQKIKMLCEAENSYRDSDWEEKTIEPLCDDVLLEVFSNLSAKEVKEASLVCNKWDQLIGSSGVTMKKFKFIINNENLELRHKNFGSSRSHQNYDVSVELLGDTSDLSHVKSLDLYGVSSIFSSSSDLMKVLSKMTSLEKLNLNTGRISDRLNESAKLVELPRLKTLLITKEYFQILEFIEAKALHDLQCIGSSSEDDYKIIGKSLAKYSKLKRLTLRSCMEIFEHIDVSEIKFKLNSFEIYHVKVNPAQVDLFTETFTKFLSLQAASLKDLRFDFGMFQTEDGQRITKEILQITFNNCKNLSSLDIRNLSIPNRGNFYQNLSPNKSLKSLKVHWNFEDEAVEGLLRNSPNLEKLQAEYCYIENDGINCIATMCKKLVHLDAFKMTGIADDDAIFENLKYLDISKIEYSFDPLVSVVTKCPLIERVQIKECRNLEALPVDLIMEQPKIEQLIAANKCYEIFHDENGIRGVVDVLSIQ